MNSIGTPPLSTGRGTRLAPIPAMDDMRLALLGGISWALAAATMHLRPGSGLTRMASLGTLIVAATLLAWSWHHPSVRGTRHLLPAGSARLTCAVIALLSSCVLIRCDDALSTYTTHPVHTMAAERHQTRCQAQILTHPRLSTFGSSYAQARLVHCSTPLLTTTSPIDVFLTGDSVATYERGAHVLFTGRLSPLEPARPPIAGRMTIDVQHSYQAPQGISVMSAALRRALHSALADAHSATQALIPGIALGDKTTLRADDERALRAASLSHIIVISGFHTGLIASLAALVLPGRGILKAGLSCLLLALIVMAVGPGASVIRAAIMGVVVVMSQVWGRGSQSGAALGLAVTAMILNDPWSALSLGFALSVAATAGVIWPAHATQRTLRRAFPPQGRLSKLLHATWAVISVSCWAQLCVIPIAAAYGLPLAPWGIVANLAVAPILVPLCLGAIGLTLTAPWSPPLAGALTTLCDPLARWVVSTAHWVAEQPGAQVTVPVGHVVFSLACVAILGTYTKNRLRKRYGLVSDLT